MRWYQLFGFVFCITLAGTTLPTIAQQPSDELKSLRQLSNQFYKAKDFDKALTIGEQALELTIKEFGANHEQTAIATYGLGLSAEQVGDDTKAVRYFGETVKIREIVYGVDGPAVADALDLYGRALMRTNRHDEAERVFRRALKLRKDLLGMEHAFQASSTANIGAVLLAQGNYRDALVFYRKAISLLASQKTDFVFAQKVLNQGLQRQRSAFIGLARAVRHGGAQLGLSARAAFDESFQASQDAWRTSAAEAIAKMSARLGTSDTPLGRDVSHIQRLADEILALNEADMRELARWSKVQRANPAYLKAQQEMKAASIKQQKAGRPDIRRQRELGKQMTDLIKRCPPGQKKAGCAGSLGKIKQLGAELTQLSKVASAGSQDTMAALNRMTAIEKTLPGYAAFSSARNERVNRISKLGIERRALKAKIIKAYPAYASMADPLPLNGNATRGLLSANEALITMLVGRDTSFVWLITNAATVWAEIDLGERELGAEVAALRLGLDPFAAEENPEAAVFDLGRAHRLYKRLLGPLERHFIGKKHLILVPNGPLTSLPPQVLVTRKPGTFASPEEAWKNTAWLVRSHALSVLPSVQSLASLRRLQRAAKSRKPFIGIGDPVLKGDQQDTSRGAKLARRTAASFYTRGLADVRAVNAMTPLPDTADELRAIGKVLGASADDILLREVASEPEIKSRPLDRYRIVHFATHGLVAGDLSGLNEPALVLTPPAKASQLNDGLLTASEIATLSLDADWVVLSACNTAAGNDVGAEALSGLARAFFFAGARALLVSHWAVYSDAAVKLTTHTFDVLKRKPQIGRAEAFRQSMLALI
ncbi:MAG: CHAT domain-containing protein, partial [Hyphomicrobiaceae bacterium]